MTRKNNSPSLQRLALASLAALAAAEAASAGPTPDPGGYSTVQTMPGVEGLSDRPGAWRNDPLGSAVKFTSFANEPITFNTAVAGPWGDESDWRIGITAREFSRAILPASYTNFRLGVELNGRDLGELLIPASDTEDHTVFFDAGELPAETSLKLRWLNKPSPGFGASNHAIGISAVQFAVAAVPSPGAAGLAMLGLATCAIRRRRA